MASELVEDRCFSHGLEFSRVLVDCLGTRGTHYTRWIGVGMPAIPQYYQDSVVYLYRDSASALSGDGTGGSGFLYAVPSRTRMGRFHVYVISNWHVAVEQGFSVVRVNTIDGGTEAIEFDPADWTFIPNGGDVAVTEIALDEKKHSFHQFGSLPLPRPDAKMHDMSSFWKTGEDVFMLGRFIDVDGGQRNRPAARFGNISVMPIELRGKARAKNSAPETEYYLIDMHSRTGFSGSPVFAYRTMGSEIDKKLEIKQRFNGDFEFPIHQPIVGLLGIHCGQFYDDNEQLVQQSGLPVASGLSGMTYVLPARNIIDLLRCEKLSQRRAALDDQWKGAPNICQE